jgi:hypothetical protein
MATLLEASFQLIECWQRAPSQTAIYSLTGYIRRPRTRGVEIWHGHLPTTWSLNHEVDSSRSGHTDTPISIYQPDPAKQQRSCRQVVIRHPDTFLVGRRCKCTNDVPDMKLCRLGIGTAGAGSCDRLPWLMCLQHPRRRSVAICPACQCGGLAKQD